MQLRSWRGRISIIQNDRDLELHNRSTRIFKRLHRFFCIAEDRAYITSPSNLKRVDRSLLRRPYEFTT